LFIFGSTSIELKEKPLSITLTISQLKKVGEAINQTEIESIQVARGLSSSSSDFVKQQRSVL
jgi:hypothetical protein